MQSHIRAIKISKKEKMRDKDQGRILFKDVMMENFPNFMKSFKSPGSSVNLKQDKQETTAKYVVVKLFKIERGNL